VAQASGRASGEAAINAISVSTCDTVTALPPARAGSATGRRSTTVAANPRAATMSRSNAACTGRPARAPSRSPQVFGIAQAWQPA